MVLAVDFDGTLVSNKYPDIGEPNNFLVNKLKDFQKRGNKLILWTCRTDDDLINAVAFCSDILGITFDAINSNLPERIEYYKSDPRKIGADYYIDDKALPPELFSDIDWKGL